ncbi:MAG: AAA family ATPase, partial [Oscillospiraceae bacterium]|nr:AAA family ATPase [Oscillospiraceae bacterium]
MLRELSIENLAVIEKANILFDVNFTVFTGETGAGKSVLIGGMGAVLGQRVSKDTVRTGCKKAVVTALFTDLNEDVKNKLTEFGFDTADELVITREIYADGKSTARINLRPATAAILKELGGLLINIHGQHDSQILLSPESHLNIIDSFGNVNDLLEDYRDSFKQLQSLSRTLKELVGNEKDRESKIRQFKQTVKDIGALNPRKNEDTA